MAATPPEDARTTASAGDARAGAEDGGKAAAEGPAAMAPGAKAAAATPWSDPEDYEKAVGWKVRVWWPRMQRWYPGRVSMYDPETGTHTVRYNDGDVTQVSIGVDTIHWLSAPPKGRRGGGATASSPASAPRAHSRAPEAGYAPSDAGANWIRAAKLADDPSYVNPASVSYAPAPDHRRGSRGGGGRSGGTGGQVASATSGGGGAMNWVTAARLVAQGINPADVVEPNESPADALRRAKREVELAKKAEEELAAQLAAHERQLQVEAFLEADRRQREALFAQAAKARAPAPKRAKVAQKAAGTPVVAAPLAPALTAAPLVAAPLVAAPLAAPDAAARPPPAQAKAKAKPRASAAEAKPRKPRAPAVPPLPSKTSSGRAVKKRRFDDDGVSDV